MSEHIEDTLLALAEKATPGPWEAEDDGEQWSVTATVDGEADAICYNDRNGNNAAYIASLSPATVAAMCRVVEAGRYGCSRFCDDGDPLGTRRYPAHENDCPIAVALATLDASAVTQQQDGDGEGARGLHRPEADGVSGSSARATSRTEEVS